MINPVCMTCNIEMNTQANGIYVIERRNGASLRLSAADLVECPGCNTGVAWGFSRSGINVFDDDFDHVYDSITRDAFRVFVEFERRSEGEPLVAHVEDGLWFHSVREITLLSCATGANGEPIPYNFREGLLMETETGTIVAVPTAIRPFLHASDPEFWNFLDNAIRLDYLFTGDVVVVYEYAGPTQRVQQEEMILKWERPHWMRG